MSDYIYVNLINVHVYVFLHAQHIRMREMFVLHESGSVLRHDGL